MLSLKKLPNTNNFALDRYETPYFFSARVWLSAKKTKVMVTVYVQHATENSEAIRARIGLLRDGVLC